MPLTQLLRRCILLDAGADHPLSCSQEKPVKRTAETMRELRPSLVCALIGSGVDQAGMHVVRADGHRRPACLRSLLVARHGGAV